MTAEQASQEWQRGSDRAFRAARNMLKSKDFELALFTCHLAVEKQLKAYYIRQKSAEPPKTHNLEDLCALLALELSPDELKQLSELTTFSTFARYGNETWVDVEATQENCEYWLNTTKLLLQKFHS